MAGKGIAIITTGDVFERRGFINAVISKAYHLQEIAFNKQIDVFLFGTYEPWLVRWLRHHKKKPCPSSIIVDNVKYNLFWQKYSIIDYILRVRLGLPEIFSPFFFKSKRNIFKDYELLSCHSLECGRLASIIKQEYGIPYVMTWHGSDIHTLPFNNTYIFRDTKKIIEDAACNFFVSEALKIKSNEITSQGIKQVLYNGCDKSFYKYSAKKIAKLKGIYDIGTKRVVGFVGNFMEIKNVLLLPKIFQNIYNDYPNVLFWMIGDGKLLNTVKSQTTGLPIIFWHGQPVNKMPEFMNLIDVIVLPSKNEGLPLVLTEALSCGIHAVSSRVGGCPEVIGIENTIPLDSPSFCNDFANAVVKKLQSSCSHDQSISPLFNWEESAKLEYKIMLQVMQNQLSLSSKQ